MGIASDDPAETAMERSRGNRTSGLPNRRTPSDSLRHAAPDLMMDAATALPTAMATLSAQPGQSGAH